MEGSNIDQGDNSGLVFGKDGHQNKDKMTSVEGGGHSDSHKHKKKLLHYFIT